VISCFDWLNCVESSYRLLMTKRVKSYLALTLIYGLTWFPLLATQRAFFWDDWVLHNDNKAITNYFIQAGTPWIVNLHIGLGYDPTLYRIITFVAFLMVALGFMYILEKSVTLTGFSTATNLVTAIAAVVIPINTARYSLIVLPYSISIGLFVAAWALLLASKKPLSLPTIVAFVFFWTSFTTNSMLFFFVIPIANKYFLDRQHGVAKPGWLAALRQYGWYFALPVIWFGGKKALFHTYGVYSGYNEFKPLYAAATVIAGAVFALAIWFGVRAGIVDFKTSNLKRNLVIAAALVFVAALPYAVVGLTPPFTEWSTRHAMLWGFGLSLLVGSIWNAVATAKLGSIVRPVIAIALIVCGAASLFSGLTFKIEELKQSAFETLVAKIPAAQLRSLIVIDDQSKNLNAYDRTYRYYEWTGQFTEAVGSPDHLVIADTKNDARLLQSGFYEQFLVLGKNHYTPQDTYLKLTLKSSCDRWGLLTASKPESCFTLGLETLKTSDLLNNGK